MANHGFVMCHTWPEFLSVSSEEDIKRYNTGNKDRDILMAMYRLDKGVGSIVGLKQTGQYENVLFFYLSDNGGSAKMVANTPFQGSKQYDYEGGVPVPFCVTAR